MELFLFRENPVTTSTSNENLDSDHPGQIYTARPKCNGDQAGISGILTISEEFVTVHGNELLDKDIRMALNGFVLRKTGR